MRNWAQNVGYTSTGVVAPTSVEELQDVVAAAGQVKALGSRHSFNDCADTSGTQVRVDGLPARLSVDTSGERPLVTCAGGMTHAALSEELARAGLALPNMASLPHISVAGAIQTGTHGSGTSLRPLSGTVTAVEVVTADGQLRTLRRGDPDFEGVVVGLGAVGVVTAVTQEVVPAFDVEQRVYLATPWDRVVDHLEEILASGYSVSVFTRFDSDSVPQIWVKNLADSKSGPVDTRAADLLTGLGATPAPAAVHPLPDTSADNVTTQLGVPGPSHRRLPHFRHDFMPGRGDEIQSEYLLDLSTAAVALEAVRRVGHVVAPVLHMAEIRAVAADDGWMSPSHGRDSVAIHFTWQSRPDDVARVVAELEAVLIPLGARPHWGKVFAYGLEELRRAVPRHGQFTDLVRRWDPTGTFDNAFLQRVLGPR